MGRSIKDIEDIRAEYDDQSEEDFQACIYTEIDWIRFEFKRKPGWTAYTFKELFGVWPPEVMKTLTPTEPREELRKWLRRRDNAWKKDMKAKEQSDVVERNRSVLDLNSAGSADTRCVTGEDT